MRLDGNFTLILTGFFIGFYEIMKRISSLIHLKHRCGVTTATEEGRNKSHALYKHQALIDAARENVAYKFCKQNKMEAYISVSRTCVTLLPYNTK